MAIPVREDGSQGPQKHLVVFVHGFGSSSSCWDHLIRLLRSDESMVHYELRCYSYPTSTFFIGLRTRLPKIKELARGLGGFLAATFGGPAGPAYVDITLVAHSMGGLIVQSWLKYQLQEKRQSDVKQIRQILLFATPNEGSRLLSPLRRLVYSVFPNAQEQALRIFNDEIDEITRFIRSNVVEATKRESDKCPIPIHAFWGSRDAVVEEKSARGTFSNDSVVACDHHDIICPKDAESDSYQQISQALREPLGHKNIFEVSEFRFLVNVEPKPSTFRFRRKHGQVDRMETAMSVAKIQRSARFSQTNRCQDCFTIKYVTQENGYVQYHTSHEQANLVSAQDFGIYENDGHQAEFKFCPECQQTYCLHLQVFRGFDQRACDVHQHIPGNAYFNRFVFQLDLTSYLIEGFAFESEPLLCVIPHECVHTSLCLERGRTPPTPAVRSSPGLWRWELDHLREGVIDVRWRWTDGEPRNHSTSQTDPVQLT